MVFLAETIFTLFKLTFERLKGHWCKFDEQIDPISWNLFKPYNLLHLVNIDTLALKLANIWHFDLILEHFLHTDLKCVTMETRNLKYNIFRTFPPSIG